jgi:hypothetical protein
MLVSQYDWDNITSGCWLNNPLINYATAVLFAGCVLYNPQKRITVHCLVAESYGQGLDVDVHAEKPVPIVRSISTISQPLTSGLYPHATVCQIQHDKNAHRLVVGCKIFNILATEVWRLDMDCSSERAFTTGSCYSAFLTAGSEKIRIFVHEISILGEERPSSLEELMGDLAGCVSVALYRYNEKVVVPQLKK